MNLMSLTAVELGKKIKYINMKAIYFLIKISIWHKIPMLLPPE